MAKRVFSGIQPTGTLHIGNYLGAIRNWVDLQRDLECIYCVVDYHAITIDVDPKELKTASRSMALDLLACGVDPERSILFVQADVPQHTELAWILGCVTSYGDLARMTQFKDKSEKQEFVTAGLFTYPILQAADILMYKAQGVPVGEDQVQHLETLAAHRAAVQLALRRALPRARADRDEGRANHVARRPNVEDVEELGRGALRRSDGARDVDPQEGALRRDRRRAHARRDDVARCREPVPDSRDRLRTRRATRRRSRSCGRSSPTASSSTPA